MPFSSPIIQPGRGADCSLRICLCGSVRNHAIGHCRQSHGRQGKCDGIHWEVLDWNEKAIAFYKALGAVIGGGWFCC